MASRSPSCWKNAPCLQAHRVRFDHNDQLARILSLNQTTRSLPSDPDGPVAMPLALFESGAILVPGRKDRAVSCHRHHAPITRCDGDVPDGLAWGRCSAVGFFQKFAGAAWEDKRPARPLRKAESSRASWVLDQHLRGRNWMMGDEIQHCRYRHLPWVRNLVGFYAAGELVGFDDFAQVRRVLDAFVARPAVARTARAGRGTPDALAFFIAFNPHFTGAECYFNQTNTAFDATGVGLGHVLRHPVRAQYLAAISTTM